MQPVRRRLVVGISGASGFCYGLTALSLLKARDIETHVVVSQSAHLIREQETSASYQDVVDLADVLYDNQAIGAAIASGSFETLGMLIAPCSVRTLSEIANGITGSLLTRSADVTLKERRRLVLMFRETPLHSGHLSNMQSITNMGGIVFPPVPAFYTHPDSVAGMVTDSVSRALGLLGFDLDMPRWGENGLHLPNP